MKLCLFLIQIIIICPHVLSLLKGYEFTDNVVVEVSNRQDSFAVLNFLYYEGENLTAVAEIIDDINVLIHGIIDESTKTGCVNITSADMSALEFGAYHLMVRVESEQGETEMTDLVIFYDEAISDFQVPEPKMLALTDDNTLLQATVHTGSSLDVEWFVDGNVSERVITPGHPPEVSLHHTYQIPDDYNVTVIARNSQNEAYLTNFRITVIRPVEGFFVNVSKLVLPPNITAPITSPCNNSMSCDNTTGPCNNSITCNNSTGDDNSSQAIYSPIADPFASSPTEILIFPGDTINLNIFLDLESRLPMGNLTVTIDYDDGSNESVYIGEDLSRFLTNGFEFTHTYIEQGDYNVSIIVESDLSSQIMTSGVHVWEDIRDVSLTSDILARVFQSVPFDFMNKPQKGFEFILQYGDGNEKVGSKNLSYSDFAVDPWDYSYTDDGVYMINMTAWNPFYISNIVYEIRIQFPIPELEIQPVLTYPPEMIPIPDGLVRYDILMINSDPTPTNVTCYYSFESDQPLFNKSVDIVSGKMVKTFKTYETSGLKNVSIYCENDVSNYSLETQVYMQDVELVDFEFTYQPVHGMNKTLSSALPDDVDPRINDEPVTIHLTASLFECKRFPAQTEIKYDYADGTSPTPYNTLPNLDHTYTTRGDYNITVTIKNATHLVTKTLPIKIGVVDLAVNMYLGSVDQTPFIFNMSGIGFGSYQLDVDDNTIYDLDADPANVIHYYTRSGSFLAKLVAFNETFKEIIYLPKYIVVDYNMTGLGIEMPAMIDLPPGNLTVRVTSSSNYPFVTCVFNMGDLIDRQIYTMMANVTTDEPLLFEYPYQTLGNHTASIVCSNNYDVQTFTTKIRVWNECFTVNGIFDRQYSNTSNPLQVFTSIDFDLASRMAVFCSDQSVIFEWVLYSVLNQTGYDYDTVLFPYTPVGKPRGTIRFAKGTVPAGLYKVFLTVTLQKTYVTEPTFVEFIKSPPFASIEGGNERNIQVKLQNTTLNALDVSFDPEIGIGGNKELDFEWSCKRLTVSTLDDLEKKYGSVPDSFEDCDDRLTDSSPGLCDLLLIDEPNQGYVITVNVTLVDMHTMFTQLIYGVFGSPPSLKINCTLNCNTKYAVMLKSDWTGICTDCDVWEDISYHWHLDVKDASGNWVELTNYQNMLQTSVSAKALVIAPNRLQPNTYYRLAVTATGYGRLGTGEARIIFLTNMAPYGGSCVTLPSKGFALTTLFAIKCKNWKDEGEERDRDPTRDGRRNNPLIYEYYMEQKFPSDNGTKVFKMTILKAGEMTASALYLPAGSPQIHYLTELVVKITDLFGDYSEFKMNATIVPDEDLRPVDENDIDKTTKLLEKTNFTTSITHAGGNTMGVMRVIASAVSQYSLLNVPVDTAPDEAKPDDILNYGERNVSEVETVLQVTTNNFVNEIFSRIPDGDTEAELLAADVILVSKSMEKCIEKTGLNTEEASETVFNSARTLLKNIRVHTRKKPFPMSELTAIQESTSDILSLVSKNLDFFKTAGDEDINKTLSKEDTEKELQDYYAYHPGEMKEITPEYVDKVYQKRLKIRRRKKRLAKAIMRSYRRLFESVDEAFNITSSTVAFEEAEKVIKTDNLNISLQKDYLDTFKNKSKIKRDGYSFDFGNETLVNVTSRNVQLKVATFKKSPMIHAKGASGVKGSIIKIQALDDDEQTIEFPLNVTISNEGVSHYREYEPIDVEGGSASMMYFKSHMADSNDAFITYLKPVGFDITSAEYDELYKLYARSGTIPSEIENDCSFTVKAIDWEASGFKVFIPSGCLQSGDVYIALKPIKEHSHNSTLLSRKRRSTSNATTSPPDHAVSNISVVIVTTGCRTYDESTESWITNGCSVLPFSTLNETVCHCPPGAGTLFASTFAIPNMIDFHSVWSKFDITNASVYGTLIAVFVFYIIFAIILRRMDNREQDQCVPTFLSDNDCLDRHFYMITVQTGLRVGSGTESNIHFILGGTDADTGVRKLSDGIVKIFKTNSTRNFIMGSDISLGDLVYLRIWHDNSGEGKLQSWFLHRVVVTDLVTNQKYIFICDRWLAIDLDDGMIERVVPVLTDNNSGFQTTFSHTTRINVTENHLWLSLVIKPPYSAFTRTQRLSCLLALLLLTMISNAMFFQTESETEVTADTVRLGSLTFSFKTLYISLVGAVITVPAIFVLTNLFRNTRRRQRHVKRESQQTKLNTEKTNLTGSFYPLTNLSPAPVKNIQDQLQTTNPSKPLKDGKTYSEIVYRRHARFPPWMRNVTWFILFLACAASSFFLILYSMEWGKTKSEEWLTTFLLSFVESIVIIDPIKVFILAFLVALILRKQDDDQELQIDLESVQQYSKEYAGVRTETFRDFKISVLANSGLATPKCVEDRRKELLKQKIAKEAFVKLVIHIMFVAVLFSISYVNRDQRSFFIKTHVENQMYASSKYKLGFSKVKSPGVFVNWSRETLFPNFFPTSEYNGQPISIRDKFLTNDLKNAKVGVIRMRQVRVKKDECYGLQDGFKDVLQGHFCGRKFDTYHEDKSEFCQGCPKSLTSKAWKYTPAEDIWGISIVGLYNTYSGGGYIQEFHNTKANTLAMFDQLVENMWIDRLTRAVFVEFTLYNANINLLCYSIFLAELMETGGGTNWVDTQCFRPTYLSDATGLFSILFYTLFLLILLYRTKLLITNIKNQRCAFWKSFWNLIDALICFFGYSGVGVWVGKFLYTEKALDLYFNNVDMFINFQHIVIWEYVFNIILGCLVFISTLRVLSALEYNKRLTAIADVIRHGGSDILRFGFIVFVGVAAFAFLGFLLFGPTVYEYRTIFITFGSLTNTLIGRNSLDSMIRAAPMFAEVYFFVYAFFVIFTLLTVFAAVLNDSISHVRAEQQNQEEAVGIFDVIKNTFKDMLGLVGIHVKRHHGSDAYVENYQKKEVDSANVLKLMREMLSDVPQDAQQEKDVSTTKPRNRENTATPSHIGFEMDDKQLYFL